MKHEYANKTWMHLSFENIKFENLNLHLKFEEIAKDQQFTDKNIFKDT
jgi:hypothetical protein